MYKWERFIEYWTLYLSFENLNFDLCNMEQLSFNLSNIEQLSTIEQWKLFRARKQRNKDSRKQWKFGQGNGEIKLNETVKRCIKNFYLITPIAVNSWGNVKLKVMKYTVRKKQWNRGRENSGIIGRGTVKSYIKE